MARTRCPFFCQVSPSTNATTGCAGCFKCLTAGINVCPGSLSLLDGFLPKSLMDLLDFLDLGSHQGQRWRSRGHPEQPGLSTRSTESAFQAGSSPSVTRPFFIGRDRERFTDDHKHSITPGSRAVWGRLVRFLVLQMCTVIHWTALPAAL